jgi:hypothetical protein
VLPHLLPDAAYDEHAPHADGYLFQQLYYAEDATALQSQDLLKRPKASGLPLPAYEIVTLYSRPAAMRSLPFGLIYLQHFIITEIENE